LDFAQGASNITALQVLCLLCCKLCTFSLSCSADKFLWTNICINISIVTESKIVGVARPRVNRGNVDDAFVVCHVNSGHHQDAKIELSF